MSSNAARGSSVMTSRAGMPSERRPNTAKNAALPCMIRWAAP